jgi:dCTP diphosphatase
MVNCFEEMPGFLANCILMGEKNSMNELEQLQQAIRKFRDDRDWMQFHNPKNLACSISIEAAELLEHFQWKTPQESETITKEKRTEISHEIADIAVYLIELADNLEIDLVQAIRTKLALNEAKYPVLKAKGSAAKYTEL